MIDKPTKKDYLIAAALSLPALAAVIWAVVDLQMQVH
jgi:hypothetical protein